MAALNTIMVIDDDEVYHYLCERIVQKSGVDAEYIGILSAEDALEYLKDAIEKEDKPIPDLIFLDINMPGTDGWEFLEEYKKLKGRLKKRIPIVMLSTSVFKEDQDKAAEYDDVVDYVAKPLKPDHVRELKERLFQPQEH